MAQQLAEILDADEVTAMEHAVTIPAPMGELAVALETLARILNDVAEHVSPAKRADD